MMLEASYGASSLAPNKLMDARNAAAFYVLAGAKKKPRQRRK